MYNFNHLYYFYICAQFKSISRGAVYLNTSQPSLSIQIKTLEEQFKVKLFNRNGRNLELSSEGEVIFSFCEKMFTESQNITNFLNNKSIKKNESINIGVSEQIERPYTADIIGTFIHQNKKNELPKIKMQTLPSSEMLSLLKIGKMDIVVTHERVISKNLEVTTLEIPVALVGQKKFFSAAAEGKTKTKSFLNHYDQGFIVPIDDFQLRRETDIFFSKQNSPYEIIFESGNLSASIRAINEGIGVGFLPVIYIIKELKNGKLGYIMPHDGLWKHSIYIYCSKKSLEKESIKHLIGLFEKSAKINL